MLLISTIPLPDGGVLSVYAEQIGADVVLTIKAEGVPEGYNLDLNGVFLDYEAGGSNKLSVDGEKANALTGTSYDGSKILWDVAESLGSTVGGSDGITTNLEATATLKGLTLADIDGALIGIRATSTGLDSEGSLKLVGEVVVPPVGPPPCDGDSFPVWGQDISHVVLYFDTTEGDTNGDGYYTVKIDDWDVTSENDLNAKIDDIVAWLVENDPYIHADTVLLGAHIKGGKEELNPTTYFDIDCDPDDVDALPFPLTELVESSAIDNDKYTYEDVFGVVV